jgi:hypothetical protein
MNTDELTAPLQELGIRQEDGRARTRGGAR